MGFGVWGLGFGVWGLGFGVWGLGFGGYRASERNADGLIQLGVMGFCSALCALAALSPDMSEHC